MASSWQYLLDLLVARAKEDGTLSKIRTMSSEGELIDAFMDDSYREKLLPWISEVCISASWMKCNVKAKSLREAGNEKFRLLDYESCLEFYNESISYASMKSEELSLSFANRSAVLFILNHYKDAINDIDLAFGHGYPLRLHYKLHKRKGESFAKMGKHEEALAEFSQATLKLAVVEPKVNTSKLLKALQELTNYSATFTSQEICPKGSTEVANVCRITVPSLEVNEEFPFASKTLGLRKDEERGRHVIALDDISIGEILFAEKPFAAVLLPDHYKSRCHHCCGLFLAPLPCSQCTKALYCNEDCKRESWNQYHRWECSGGLNIADCVGIAHLSLRVFLKAGNLAQHKLMNSSRENNSSVANKDYLFVYNLLTHFQSLTAEDRAAYGLTAVCLVLYLIDYTDYFLNEPGPCHLHGTPQPVAQDEYLLVGSLILRHLCQLVCNGHAITAIAKCKSQADEDVVVDEIQMRIATAIYTSASMMNHSCDSNIINSFCGSSLIVKAYKNIRKGEEVYNCYGPHFRRMSRETRRSILKDQYHFQCECEQCSSKKDFIETFTAFLCKVCQSPIPEREADNSDIKCSQCGACFVTEDVLRDLRSLRDQHERGCQLELQNCNQEALEVFMSCSANQKEVLYKNHTEIRTCFDNIAKCFAKLGSYDKAATVIIKDTLPIIEEQYGSWSIEVAHELQKLTDLLIKDLQEMAYDKLMYFGKVAETQLLVQKMKKIFELHLGVWDSSLQEVCEKENMLKIMYPINSDCDVIDVCGTKPSSKLVDTKDK